MAVFVMQKLKYICDKRRHLVCKPYSIENLHKMADQLCIKRPWFHKDHYDIPKDRIEEIMNLCKVVSSKEIISIIGRRKVKAKKIELDNLTFTITSEERTKINNWSKKQDKIAKTNQTGAKLTYSFTPTGIGNIIKVKHGITGNELDLTDIDSW